MLNAFAQNIFIFIIITLLVVVMIWARCHILELNQLGDCIV